MGIRLLCFGILCGLCLGHGSAWAQQSTAEDVAITLFPNPTTNKVHLLGLPNSPQASIQILDSYGNAVVHYQWAITKNALTLPVAELPKGMYKIQLLLGDRHIRKTFIKQ